MDVNNKEISRGSAWSFLYDGWLSLRFKWKGNSLGLLWVLLHPALEILLYYIIFSSLLAVGQSDHPYGNQYLVYLCIGIIPWAVISDGLVEGSVSYVSNGYYLKKIPKPLYHFVREISLGSGISLIIGLLLVLIVAIFCGLPVSLAWLSLVFPVISLTLIIMGVNYWTSVITTYFKDFKDGLVVVLKFLFWSMPLIYFKESVPEFFQKIIEYHPLYLYFDQLRQIIILGEIYSPLKTALSFVLPLFLVITGLRLQLKSEAHLRDIL